MRGGSDRERFCFFPSGEIKASECDLIGRTQCVVSVSLAPLQGGLIIRRSSTLRQRQLQRNTITSLEINNYSYITPCATGKKCVLVITCWFSSFCIDACWNPTFEELIYGTQTADVYCCEAGGNKSFQEAITRDRILHPVQTTSQSSM